MTEPSAFERHYADVVLVAARPATLFAYLDDHRRMSAHMGQRSVMMGGGRMSLTTDAGKGQKVGSHIQLVGKFLGIRLALDEVVVRREPDIAKEWETVGQPKLIVIGPYRMGFFISPAGEGSLLKVSIDYMLPHRGRWLGVLFGGFYARWCVRQMLKGARRQFEGVLLATPRRA